MRKRGWIKAIGLMSGLSLMTGLLAGCGASSKPTLKVYSAGEYLDTSLLSEFEQENNCKVIYETFDSNESMYTKLQSGETYDVLVPSDYMIERLILEGNLQPVDWSLISQAGGLDEEILGREFDPDNTYSVPFFYGSVGILYDTTVVDEADLADGWELLRNEKYAGDIYMYDSERDSFMIALKALGYSMNTTSTKEIDEAYDWLIEQRNTMQPVYAGDDVIDNMISGNKAMAVVYSGDAAYIISENENLAYFVPEEGTNVWQDAMVITKDCTQTELAHAYIDFMLETDHAYANTIEVGYTSPVTEARNRAIEDAFAGNEAYLPDLTREKDEVFRYQEQTVREYFADLWTKVKAAN